jgi:hypothetical protein
MSYFPNFEIAKIGFEPISSDYETDKLPDYSILQKSLNWKGN